MSETTSTMIQQAEEVRRETISILDNLTGKAEEFELPKPPEALGHYRQKLEENTYKVLVVGEAKKGKSSFVNAMIGDGVLPTDVRVATSQVFSVRPAERESYRLRFEDNSVREVAREDLPLYGSQVLEDAGERPRLDQIIRWIEVDEPDIRFLPRGVSLLDTPGLGGLYAAHAQITHRFVPQANAVIFVLDSEKQIVQTELEFIETILDATSDIFFIQTKIDLFDKEHWRTILRRNKEILEEKFGDRLTGTNIWPISSTLLLTAANGDEDAEENLEDSRHEEMEGALRTFLFHVAGWSRAAEAVLVADRYRATSRQTLNVRLAGHVEDRKKREEIKKQADDRRKQFEADWGPRGRKRKELVEGIKQAAARGKRSIREALQPGGRIAIAQREKIEEVQSPEEAEQLNEAMPDEVIAAAMKEWRKVGDLAQRRCVELLGPFLAEAEAVNTLEDPDQSGLVVRGRGIQEIENKLWEKVKGSSRDFLTANMLAGIVLYVTAAPLALVVTAVGGVIAAAVYGWKSTKKRQTIKAKESLHRNLDGVLQQVRQRLLEVDMESGRDDGMVDEYFATLEQAMLNQVRDIAQQKEREARAEYARLVEAGKLNDQQRKDGVEQIRRQVAEWDEVGKAIESMSARLNELDRAPAVGLAGGIRRVEP